MNEPNDTAEQLYVEVLGLSRAPFTGAVDDALFYDDPERAQLLKVLNHLISYTNLVPFVQGPSGAGKSTLLQRFVDDAGERMRVCQIKAGPQVTGDRLIAAMAQSFGLPDRGITGIPLLDALRDHLGGMQQSSLTALLIIDDAGGLSQEVVELIIGLTGGEERGTALLHAIFFGEALPESFTRTARRLIADRDVFKTVDVPPLQEEQTVEYLRVRLTASGYGLVAPFTADNIALIHRQSGGMPGSINSFAHRLLCDFTMSEHNQTESSTQRARRPLPLIMLALAAVAIVSLWALSGRNNEPVSTVTEGPRGEQIVRPLSVPPEGMAEATAISGHIDRPGTPAAAPTQVAEAIGEAMTGTIEPHDETRHTERVTAKENRPTVRGQPQAPPFEPLPAKSANDPAERNIVADTPKREAWLRRQDPDHFTLQLVAAGREAAIVDFAKRHGLMDKAAYFHTLRKGKDWYSLVYGVYPDHAAAEAAVKSLPATLHDTKPWIRSLASIHTDIRDNAR